MRKSVLVFIFFFAFFIFGNVPHIIYAQMTPQLQTDPFTKMFDLFGSMFGDSGNVPNNEEVQKKYEDILDDPRSAADQLQKLSTPTTATESQVSTGGQAMPATNITSVRELLDEIQTNIGVPSKIMEGILIIEYGTVLKDYTSEQVQAYSQPGALIPRCGPNNCSAAGPAQMTTGIDNTGSTSCKNCGTLTRCPNAWSAYGNAVNKHAGATHQSNPCNLRDNLYAAAAKVKNDSGANGSNWTQAQVYQVARSYYGACTGPLQRFSGKSNCEFLWSYYSGR